MTPQAAFDLVVLGEPLAEFSHREPLADGTSLTLSFSGDALNVAAASVAAGARTALLTNVSDDELGTSLLAYAASLGIDVSLVARVSAPNGIYMVRADPEGNRDFIYSRRGSAAARLQPDDLDEGLLSRCSALVTSGITCAISETAAATAHRAGQIVRSHGGNVIYDPNFRRALTSADAARKALEIMAPLATVVTPSCPNDTVPLLDSDEPRVCARRLRALGADAAIVTLGLEGAILDDGDGSTSFPAVPVHDVVDTTGAGDALTGTLAARVALGDQLAPALTAALEAAALTLGSPGGTRHYLERAPKGSGVTS